MSQELVMNQTSATAFKAPRPQMSGTTENKQPSTGTKDRDRALQSVPLYCSIRLRETVSSPMQFLFNKECQTTVCSTLRRHSYHIRRATIFGDMSQAPPPKILNPFLKSLITRGQYHYLFFSLDTQGNGTICEPHFRIKIPQK